MPPFSCHLITILTLLILFFSVLVQGKNRNHYDSSLLLDTPEDREDFSIVMSATNTLFLLSCFASLYVLYRTFKQWRSNKKCLRMVYRLPFYTSCIGEKFLNL